MSDCVRKAYTQRLAETRARDLWQNQRLYDERKNLGLDTGILELVIAEQQSAMMKEGQRRSQEDEDDRRLRDYPI